MRKTLIVMLLTLTASPLAACKMPWEHDNKTAVATTSDPTPTETGQADPAQPTDPAKPAEPAVTAGNDKLIAPAKAETPAKPAAK